MTRYFLIDAHTYANKIIETVVLAQSTVLQDSFTILLTIFFNLKSQTENLLADQVLKVSHPHEKKKKKTLSWVWH